MYSVRNFYFRIPLRLLPENDIDVFSFFPSKNLILWNKTPDTLSIGFQMDWVSWQKSLFEFLTKFFQPKLFQVITYVAPIRREPCHTSEMISQLLRGETFTVFFVQEDFAFGCGEDGYFGYVSIHQIERFEKEYYRIFGWHREYPLGSKVLEKPMSFNYNQLIMDLLESPYLWGGRSNWGIDCSGLTQIFMLARNIFLPRDAYQQADFGETIPYRKHKKGDLAFFGDSIDSITHVGYILDRHIIFHAYGEVRIDKLKSGGIFHNGYHKITHKLLVIKRYSDSFDFRKCL